MQHIEDSNQELTKGKTILWKTDMYEALIATKKKLEDQYEDFSRLWASLWYRKFARSSGQPFRF
jgi:hypothetical protein